MIRFCVGMCFRERDPWLALHLPVYAQATLDGFVFLDTGQTGAGAAVIRRVMATYGYREGPPHGEALLPGIPQFHIFERPFDWDMAAQQNAMIEHAEDLGYQAMYKADPDELVFPAHLEAMKALFAEGYKALMVPQFGFMGDRYHYVPVFPYWPNFFPRAFRLGQGVRYKGRLHAPINIFDDLGWRRRERLDQDGEFEVIRVPHMPLYHYGEIADRKFRTWWAHNYNLIRSGQEPLDELPEDIPVSPLAWRIPFTGPQPLNPDEIGARAPFE